MVACQGHSHAAHTTKKVNWRDCSKYYNHYHYYYHSLHHQRTLYSAKLWSLCIRTLTVTLKT